MSAKNEGRTKSAIVVEHLLKKPTQKYSEAVEEIKKNTGIEITPAYYGLIKSNLNQGKIDTSGVTIPDAGGKPKASNGRKTKTTKARKASASPATDVDSVTTADILAAKEFVSRLGGMEQAQKSLDALTQVTA